MIQLNLEKNSGMNINLDKEVVNLKRIIGSLTWDMRQTTEADFDLDLWGFLLNANDQIDESSDIVYWGQKEHPTKCLSVPVDSRDGSKEETININFETVPSTDSTIAVYVFLHKASQRNQTFGMISNAKFTLSNAEDGKQIVQYSINQYVSDTCLHVGNFKKVNGNWHFEPEAASGVFNEQEVVNMYCA